MVIKGCLVKDANANFTLSPASLHWLAVHFNFNISLFVFEWLNGLAPQYMVILRSADLQRLVGPKPRAVSSEVAPPHRSRNF